ncbi:MAG: M1 family metallopeptidase [Ferruginibacter sp.]|nr:M1 family metallopeptidase [Cytophagales bacterium]
MKTWITCLLLLAAGGSRSFGQLLNGEEERFTRADSLRGTLTPLRTSYDVTFYHLNLRVDIDRKTIAGSNRVRFRVVQPFDRLQLDLYANLAIEKIVFRGQPLVFTRAFNAVFVQFPEKQKVGSTQEMEVFYGGSPTVAQRAPWDGGFVWSRDAGGKPWVGVACQGAGASLWWPCKDHQSDEPDSMRISVAVPPGVINVSNGRPRGRQSLPDGYVRYDWYVSNPINTYAVTLNIADYATFGDAYAGQDGNLSLDYYVLRENLAKARKQFEQVKPMLACYERYFGPYPFYQDGYKLVETPYLGMEHQSAVAYGNGYLPGYEGSATSEPGLTFDYIIIHESAHEWWGNSVTSADIADMWIHESFATYAEALYVECRQGYPAALTYMNAQRSGIGNQQPIIGPYGVNQEGSGDMYNKGMLMLNTLRGVVNNDQLWFETIGGLAREFKHKITNAEGVIAYFNRRLGKDYTYFFDQYLRHARLPTLLVYYVKKGDQTLVTFRWDADVPDFRMPVRITTAKGKYEWIEPGTDFKTLPLKGLRFEDLKVADDRFYIDVKISAQYFDPNAAGN